MRSRGVLWILPCAFRDSTGRCGREDGVAEDPRTVRQWMDRFDLAGLRCQSERSRRDMEKSRGPAEVEPRFDAVIGGLVDGDSVMRAQRGDAFTRPAVAIACHQSVSVQDTGNDIV